MPVFTVTLSERQLLSDRVTFQVEAETAEAAGQLVLDATADEPNMSALRPAPCSPARRSERRSRTRKRGRQ